MEPCTQRFGTSRWAKRQSPTSLDDHRIHTRLICSDQQLSRRLQFIAEHQDVEGQEALHTALMQPIHHLRQIIEPEVFGPLPGIERIHAEVHRIGTGGDGRLHRSPVTGGGQQLRDGQGLRLENRRAASNRRNASALPS